MESLREAQDLGVPECLRLLRSVPVGRMVFTEGALPGVHPVDFVMSGADVVLRTGRGPKLDSALLGEVVAFEADEVDAPPAPAGACWSSGTRASSPGEARISRCPGRRASTATLSRSASRGADHRPKGRSAPDSRVHGVGMSCPRNAG
jgi:hypothetical protein